MSSKTFKITEQELQVLANILGEIPAKQVIGAIDILRKLPEIENKADTGEPAA